MKLIVGLGNPGEKYAKTRHNLGFMVVEKLLKNILSVDQTAWSEERKLKSEIALVDYRGVRLILAKPQTYMNNSGMAVRLIAEYYKVLPEDIWIAYDDLDLPVGAMKIRFGGAAGGHHGVESILSALGTDQFWRFRFGIGLPHGSDSERSHTPRPTGSVEEYVLGTFGPQDHNKVREMIKSGAEAMEVALTKDLQTAQNRFNTK